MQINALRRVSSFLLLAFALLAGCGRTENPAAGDGKAADAAATSVVPIVLVAASTKNAVEEAAAEFAKSGGEVKISASASNALATQIVAGGEAHLFLSANQQWADVVEKAGKSSRSRKLLTNGLVLVVPAGNPAGVKSPADLTSEKVKKIALAGDKVPAGQYAQQALTAAKLYEGLVAANKIVRGHDVRSTLTYVERGEAEAGIVYSTDAMITKAVEVVHEFDPATYDKIVYPLVLLKAAEGNERAVKFYEFLGSEAAAGVFKKHGFVMLAE
jgi:molybdate transport system substrate-binding protein